MDSLKHIVSDLMENWAAFAPIETIEEWLLERAGHESMVGETANLYRRAAKHLHRAVSVLDTRGREEAHRLTSAAGGRATAAKRRKGRT